MALSMRLRHHDQSGHERFDKKEAGFQLRLRPRWRHKKHRKTTVWKTDGIAANHQKKGRQRRLDVLVRLRADDRSVLQRFSEWQHAQLRLSDP